METQFRKHYFRPSAQQNTATQDTTILLSKILHRGCEFTRGTGKELIFLAYAKDYTAWLVSRQTSVTPLHLQYKDIKYIQ